MGFVVLGIFSLTVIGIDGAVFTMLSHPLTTGALFLVIGLLYERRHTREISAYRGVWKSAPVMGAMFLIAMFAGIGLPGFSGFIGEFLSLHRHVHRRRPFAIVATTGVILAAVYSLWAFQRAFTGKPTGENAKMRDVTVREVVVVVPLLALSLFLGIYPKPVLDRIEPSVRRRGRRPRAQERLPRARPRRLRPAEGHGREHAGERSAATRGREGECGDVTRHAAASTGSRSRPSSRSAARRCSSCCCAPCCASGPRSMPVGARRHVRWASSPPA